MLPIFANKWGYRILKFESMFSTALDIKTFLFLVSFFFLFTIQETELLLPFNLISCSTLTFTLKLLTPLRMHFTCFLCQKHSKVSELLSLERYGTLFIVNVIFLAVSTVNPFSFSCIDILRFLLNLHIHLFNCFFFL